MRIGIYGSSFDPITNVHLWTATTVADRKKLDQVVFLPCNSKLRADDKVMKTTDEHRWNMLKLAIEDEENFIINDYEMKMTHGRTTTYETMKYFKNLYPNDELFFIMGADLLVDLPDWDHGEQLIKEFNFIIMSRDGIDMLRTISKNPILRNNDGESKFNLLDKGIAMEISSTYIRDEMAMGGNPKHMMPKECYNYMKEHQLYTDRMTNKYGAVRR